MLRTNVDFVNVDADAQDDHDHERRRGGGEVDDALEPRGRLRTGAGKPWCFSSTWTSAGRRSTSSSGCGRQPGVTEILLGRATLEQTLQRVHLDRCGAAGSATRRRGIPGGIGAGLRLAGRAHLGCHPAQPRRAGHVRRTRRADRTTPRPGRTSLLIDGPPMLLTGDTFTLSTKVDALIVIAGATSSAAHGARPRPSSRRVPGREARRRPDRHELGVHRRLLQLLLFSPE